MRIPRDVAEAIAAGQSLGIPVDHDRNALAWPHSQIDYPPVGYLEWDILQVGNGDSYGYYWTVGRESADPLVCTTEHDASLLRPIASNLKGCLRIMFAMRMESADELFAIARAFDIKLSDLRANGEPALDPEESLATLDPRSPQLLLAAARAANRLGDLDTAERRLRLALDLLPEYSEASLHLAQIYHRKRNFASAASTLLTGLATPLCFGGHAVHLECLQRVQRMRNVEMPGSVLNDALWQRRHRLMLEVDMKRNDDLPVWEEAIAAYHEIGQGIVAVRLRMLLGGLLSFEPVSIQQRYGWAYEKQGERLRNDIMRANLQTRLAAIS